MAFEKVQKRDGRIVDFDEKKITAAIYKAMKATGEGDLDKSPFRVSEKVVKELNRRYPKEHIPSIEEIQDIVEEMLIVMDFPKAAKAYILYRQERAKVREQKKLVPERIKELVRESKKHFRNALGEFIFYRTYSRWIEEEGRRETWIETVQRYINFMKENLGDKLSEGEYGEIKKAILKQEVMPSMRLLWSAGRAAGKNNVAAYNCSYIAPSRLTDFAEIMFLLMSGAGVGFSVESQTVQQLPIVKRQTGEVLKTFVIDDSKEGWGDALTAGLKAWYGGKDIKFDYSKIRPAGARLKTMGGRSSGPEPLRDLLDFIRSKILSRQGRRLANIDIHDLVCKIGEVVVAGGVRRSATISLSDLDDEEMKNAKKGQFYLTNPQRSMANNSAVYNEKPSASQFLKEWLALAESGTGERGIFNRGGLKRQMPPRRWEKFEKYWQNSGTNPCLTGDTLVYVADGRGNVPIKRLAQENKDIPVFCLTERGGITIRYMRHPRLTGKKQPVYKITLDDGSTIKATANHKFRVKSGEYREVKDLEKGDSLYILTKFEASIKDVFPTANAKSQDYWWIRAGQINAAAEHRLIAEFHHNTKIPRGYIVHHRDRKAQNNNPENLEIMTKKEHNRLHSELMLGDNNPMRRAHKERTLEKWAEYSKNMSKSVSGEKNGRFSGITDEELKNHALKLTKILGQRFSNKDWFRYAKENNLPQYFSKWRRDHLGGIKGLAKWAAQELGFEYISEDPRVVKSYKEYTSQGYNCEIIDGKIFISKKCEFCGKEFKTNISSREHGACNLSCGLKRKWRDRVFRAEFVKCKRNNISPEISRVSSHLRYYRDLKEFAGIYNHKVVSVEFSGYEDVYNGTVDEFHNFFIGGFPGETKNKKKKFVYLNNSQCGEIQLRSAEFCNLTEVVARIEDTEESLLRKIRVAAILGTYQSTLTDFHYISKEWKKNCEEERLLGVSITGQWDCPVVRGPEVLRKLKERAVEVNREYAKRFGINPSVSVTCVKPSGCRPWYALTATDRGLLTLEELFENHNENKQWDDFIGKEKVIQNSHPAKILKTYNNGQEPVLKIKMSYGLTVESTPNHRWFVVYHYNHDRGDKYKRVPVNDWVKAEDLKVGDVLELKIGVYRNNSPASLRKVNSLSLKMRRDFQPISQPEFINQDLAWFFGYLWGDGAMSSARYRIRFVDQRKDNLEKVQKILREHFGIKAKIHKASQHREAYILELGSKLLWHWLIRNDVFKYYLNRIDIIPRCVRSSSYKDIIAFIAGLIDSDGWVGKHSNKKGYTLILTASDGFFAQHIQDIAWSVGLGFGRSLNSRGGSFRKKKEMYLLTLGRQVLKDSFDILLKNSNKLQESARDKDFSNWLWENDKANSLIAGKIVSIEKEKAIPTFDIEVQNHWYYAGCVKSHNTVSQLVDAASGMHPRHSPYYIRRIRISATDPLFHMLKDQKFPYHPEVGQLEQSATTYVLEFPVRTPPGAVFRNDLTALKQLEHWKMVKENFTEHNPSVTVSVGSEEWIKTANWLYENWEILGGLAFLPREEHLYRLAPYEEITEERYKELLAKMPEIDFSQIVVYEKDDETTGAGALACEGPTCEIEPPENG